jgi:nitric oxide dioxygenase
MTPQQVALVQASYAKVAPIADQAAALFYARLFETAPETRPLFTGDMTIQGQKLMAAISTVVTSLDDLGAVVPVAEELAKRHVRYGVRAEHYAPVGAALLWALGQGLGDAFTADVSAAWAAAYTTLSGVMVAAAYSGS